MSYKYIYSIKKLCLFVWLLTAVPALSQERKSWEGFGVEAGYIGGKVFRHSSKFTGPVPAYSSAVDISLLQHTYGKKDWHQRRHYPIVGLGLTYTDYGMDSVYGKCIGLYPILQVPVIKGKHLEWTLRLGLGIGYVTNYYKRYPEPNLSNNAVGSNLNNFTMYATDLRYKINDQWAVSAGANFSHISDGSFRQPNLGVNMYGGHLAVRYYPVTSTPEKIHHDLQPLKNRWLIQARLGMSANETIAPDGPMYPIYVASLFTSKRYASRNKAYIGVDYSYHPSIIAFMRNNEIEPGNEHNQSWKSAVYIGNEFLLGRFGLVLQLGFYTKQALLTNGLYYQKLGYNFYLVQNEHGALKELCLYTLLKTHKVQAEFIEFGLGVSF